MPSFASPGGRVTTSSTSSAANQDRVENNKLLAQLEKLKLEQALAAAQRGGSASGDESPAQMQAARLASALQLVQAETGSDQAMQTQRLQSGTADLATKLVSQRTLQADSLGAQRALQGDALGAQRMAQGDRIQSTERINATQLAGQLQRQGIDIKGKRDLQTDASSLEEKRRKDAATRALALFRSAPGGSGQRLNMAAAAAELG